MIPDIRILNIFIIIFISLTVLSTQSIAQVDSGYVEIKGGKLYYEVYGKGKPLVFLNGGPGISSKAYRYIAEKFDTCTQVIIFDQRGTGKSTLRRVTTVSISIKNMVDDVEKLRTHLGIEKWDVAGQSFGGTYALHYAVKHSKQIDKLVLISTAGIDEKAIRFQKFDYPEVEKMSEVELKLLDTLIILSKDENTSADELRKYRTALKSRYYIYDWSNLEKQMNWFAHKAVYNYKTKKYVNESFYNFDISRKLKNIENPTLTLYGSSDFIPFHVADKIHKSLPNSELKVFQNCGHSIWLDKDQEARACIAKFLFDEQKAKFCAASN